MATIEEFKDMLGGELPQDVQDDLYYEKEFLQIMDGVLSQYGEIWIREHKTMCLAQWEYVSTLV